MMVYGLLCRHLPAPVANALTGLWFAALVSLILLCGPQATGQFRYENF
jgi:hypothetical protein